MSLTKFSLVRTGSDASRVLRAGSLATTIFAVFCLLAPQADAQITQCLISGPSSAGCGFNVAYTATSPGSPGAPFNATWSLHNNTAGASFVGPSSCVATTACQATVTTSQVGSVTVRVTLTFPGSVKTCQVVLTVSDFSPPVIVCPPDIVVPCPTSTDPSQTGTPVVTDCSSTTVTHSDSISGSGCSEVITRTWTATDSNGFSSTCVQTISRSSTVSIACPGASNVSCFTQVPPPNIGSVIASDSCGGPVTVTWEGDAASGGTSNCGNVIVRTYKATNACGVSATCTHTITVNDTTPPTIQCPTFLMLQCLSQVPPPNVADVVTSDNCGGFVTVTHVSDVPLNGLTNCNNVITRTYRAVDSCGNQAFCTQSIFVNDTTPPTIQCPPNETVQCFSLLPPPNIALVFASDNCGGQVNVIHVGDSASNGGSNCNNVITRTYLATDSCNNVNTCTQIITVNDTTPPAIQCPGPFGVQCLALVPPPDTASVFTSDNCGVPQVTHVSDVQSNPNQPNCNNVITRTYRSTDSCGNQATCTQLITVNDTTPPSIQCPPLVSVQCFALVPPPDIQAPTASDNCAGAVLVEHLGDVPTNGNSNCDNTITRTYRATDSCGNTATCTQTILVNDTTPPSITCPLPASVECFANVPQASTTAVITSDNCNGQLLVEHVGDEATNGTSSCDNTITRTYRATDSCGNEATCTQTITVDDVTPPVITCPPPYVGVCGDSIDPLNTGTATATDNCDPSPDVTFSDVSTGGCPLSSDNITRTWTATDDCGNVSTCIQFITLIGGGGSIPGCITVFDGGCGNPVAPQLTALLSTPPPVLSISLDFAAPNAQGLLFAQWPPFSPPMVIGPCAAWVDPTSFLTFIATQFMTDSNGEWDLIINPIPPFFHVRLQAAMLAPGQPLGSVQLSNGLEIARPGPCPPPSPCTHTLGQWAANSGPADMLYDAEWLNVFPSGMMVGLFNGGSPGFGLFWTGDATGRNNLKTCLATPGGVSGPLSADAVNPTSTTSGTFARMTAVLQLNLAFNAAGLLGSSTPPFGSFIYSNPGDSLDGLTIAQILGVCNNVLSGAFPPPAGHTAISLTGLLEDLQNAYTNCVPSSWATMHLSEPID